MTKSFVFLAFALSVISVHTSLAGSDGLRYSYEIDSGSESEDEGNENEQNPAPSCLLFGEQACNIECMIVGQIYDVTAHGYCNMVHFCRCHIYHAIPFKDAWRKKFHTGYTFRKIIEDKLVLLQVRDLFNYPLRTADQFKELLKPIISPYQISKLETRDQTLAAKFTKKDDSVDVPAVEKYVSQEVDKMLKSSGESLLTRNYKEIFRRFLDINKDSQGTLHNLIFTVRELNNKSLEEVLKAYLRSNNLSEREVELYQKEGIRQIITKAVINEISKQNDERSKMESKKPVVKRGPRYQGGRRLY
ncbi:hypothetical protein U1Q18_049273 [Sarracenia purpurea var. burkii]